MFKTIFRWPLAKCHLLKRVGKQRMILRRLLERSFLRSQVSQDGRLEIQIVLSWSKKDFENLDVFVVRS